MCNVRMARKLHLRLGWMQQMVRVDTVYYIYLVPEVPKSMRETIDIHRIPAKTVGRIKGSEMAKPKRASHRAITFGMRLIICCAAASQDSRLAALIPASRILLRMGSELKT